MRFGSSLCKGPFTHWMRFWAKTHPMCNFWFQSSHLAAKMRSSQIARILCCHLLAGRLNSYFSFLLMFQTNFQYFRFLLSKTLFTPHSNVFLGSIVGVDSLISWFLLSSCMRRCFAAPGRRRRAPVRRGHTFHIPRGHTSLRTGNNVLVLGSRS